MSRTPESFDAVVIGGTTRGLVACHLLAQLGYRVALVDRSARPGGVDRSFTVDGTTFDHGLHVLDEDRSAVATRLFTHVVGGAVHRTRLRRGIVLRGEAMPYAPDPSEMPASLRALLPPGEIVDDLGGDPPTRERLARIYGDFAHLVFDEVLPSFPSEARHLTFGVDASRLMANVYPWFFPRARRRTVAGDESRVFHDRLREGTPQFVLYPRKGGFGGFVDGFLASFEASPNVTLLTGAEDLDVAVVPGTHTVRQLVAGGRRLAAPHYFWGGGWPALCSLLDLPCQDVATDRVVLGSFRFDRPPDTRFMELLVGDPSMPINRIYFPQTFRHSEEPLMQIEFAHPVAETPERDADGWREVWLEGARRLGLIGREHRVLVFDQRAFQMHFNAYGMEGEPLRDADPGLLRADSNVRPLVPSMANLNLNAHVPRNVHYVASVIGQTA